MTEKKFEESRLLALLSEDSQYAFQLLFDRYKDHIYKVAIGYVKSPLIAEEVVQDVFMKVWLNRKQLLTRKWFAWSNTIFGELIMDLYQQKPALLNT